MVLNVVGSNPTGHPKRKSQDFLLSYSGMKNPWGFAIDVISAQRKIPVVLHPVHQNPRFHGQKLILILCIHEMPCFRGQELHKACGASPWAQLAQPVLRSWLAIFASCGALQILSDFPLSSGNMPVFPDESAPIVRFVIS